MDTGNRPQLPLASSGCSCCATPNAAEPSSGLRAATPHDAPAAVVHSDADVPATAAAGYALA